MTAPDPDPLASARAWLHTAAAELGVEAEIVDELTDDILDLTRDIAHGRSRPAGPVTAFLVGLSAGRAERDTTATAAKVRSLIAGVTELLEEEQ